MFLINVKLKQSLRISPAQYVSLDYAVLIAAANTDRIPGIKDVKTK